MSEREDSFVVKTVSVVIPTLNERGNVEPLMRCLNRIDGSLEVVFSDGRSSDRTRELAGTFTRAVSSERGRGVQMNTGARQVTGDVIWFLHADCRPHPDSVDAIRKALGDPGVVGGAFEYSLDHPGRIFRVIEYLSNRKNRLLNLAYGDMGIFVKREVFHGIGGYAEIPLMEDMDLWARLRRSGKVVLLPCRISTSARRWLAEGIMKNTVRNWLLQIAWKLGVSPWTLSRWYRFGGSS